MSEKFMIKLMKEAKLTIVDQIALFTIVGSALLGTDDLMFFARHNVLLSLVNIKYG